MQKTPHVHVLEQRSSAFAAFCSATCPRKAVTWALLWSSLPVASKVLIAFLVGQTGLWLGYTAGNGARIATACTNGTAALCTAEQWQAMASTLAAQLSLAYLTLDAIHEENAFQMLTSTVFSVLSGLLWVIFVAVLGPMMLGWRFALVCSFIAATAINLWLAYITYQQFGWRIHSRLACDYRRKHAAEKLQLYFLVSRFKTLLRFSWHAILVNMINCAVLALTTRSSAAITAAPAAPAAEQQVLTVPIGVATAAPLLMQYSHVAAPLAVAVNNSSVSLQQNSTSAYDAVEATVAAAARAAVAGAQSVGAAAILEQVTAASMQSNSNSSAVTGLLASLAVWLLPAAWLMITYMAVARNSIRLQQLSSAALPVLLLLPVLPLYWVFSPIYFWPERTAVRVLLLACPMAVWLGLAFSVWRTMATLMKQFRLPIVLELLAAAVDDSDNNAYQQHVPEQLQPLLQGAWLLKPSYTLDAASSSSRGSSRLNAGFAGNSSIGSSSSFETQQAGAANTEAMHPVAWTSNSKSCSWVNQVGLQLFQCCQSVAATVLSSNKRWRFFQLSSDLTMLRWAWNKYILLYYVDSITADADQLTITLHMVLDPDLTIAFDDPKTYDHWESALQLLLHMLTGAAPGSCLHDSNRAIAMNSGFKSQAGQDPASPDMLAPGGHSYEDHLHDDAEDMLGSKQWTGPAALRAPSFSQHSLVMTALNVQYGLEGARGSLAVSGRMSAGLGTKVKSRNSFLRSSRRHSVGDPEARKLRQAQSMVELMSQHLSRTSVSFSAAQQSSRCSPFPQQQDWQQQEWQQQTCEPSAAAAAATAMHAAACSPTENAAASAAMRAASQVLLLPHQLASHQQQKQQGNGQVPQQQQLLCSTGTTTVATAVQSLGLGPFRTPVGLLQHLQQHQQLSSWQEPDSGSGGEGATVSTSCTQSGTSSHATPMHSGSLNSSLFRSSLKQCVEITNQHDDGSVNLDTLVGAASSGRASKLPPQQLQLQRHGGMHSSGLCVEHQSSSSLEHQNSTSVGRSGYISLCSSPEPGSMSGKASLLAAQQQGMSQQLQSQQPLSSVLPGSLPIQQHHQQQSQQHMPSSHMAGTMLGAPGGLGAVSPYQPQLQAAQATQMLRSNSMPASLEALSRDMQQAVVAVAAEAGCLVPDEQRLSRTALAVSSCSALDGILQGMAARKPGGHEVSGKDAHGLGAFMPPLPENSGCGIRAVWGSEDAASAADSVHASAGGSLGVLSSTTGGSQGEQSYAGGPGIGQVVVRPGPEYWLQNKPGDQKLSGYSTGGCNPAAVGPAYSNQPGVSTLDSIYSQANSNNPGARSVDYVGDVAIAIEQAGLAGSCSSQHAKVLGMQPMAFTGTWKASLRAILASISGAAAQRVAGTANHSVPQNQMHVEQMQQKGSKDCKLQRMASSSLQDLPFSDPVAVAAAAADNFDCTGVLAAAAADNFDRTGVLAAAAQVASQQINPSTLLTAVTDADAQPCNSHGSFSTMGWSAASRSNTPWSNVGSLDALHCPGPALAAAAAASVPMKALAYRTSLQSHSWQEAADAGVDVATSVLTAPPPPAPAAAAVHCTVPVLQAVATSSNVAPPALILPWQTPPVSCFSLPASVAAGGRIVTHEVGAHAVTAAGQQMPPASTVTAAPAEDWNPSDQKGMNKAAGTSIDHAKVPEEGTQFGTLMVAPLVVDATSITRGSTAVTSVSQQQPPRLAYGLPAAVDLRRLGSVSFNSMPQLPVLPEAPASAELDSNENSNEESDTRNGSSSSSSSDSDSSTVGGNKPLSQQTVCTSRQEDGPQAAKQQSPFMTVNFAAAEQEPVLQQHPFTLQAAYHFATCGASRHDLPPSPRSPKSPRAAWLRQQQQVPHVQQLGMHLSDGMPHGLGSHGSGVLKLQGSGHLGSQGSGRLGTQGSGHLGTHGSGRVASQGSGHLAAQGSGRLVPQGSGRLAAQGSWGLRAQGSMHLSMQGHLGAQGLGQGGLADPGESPRGLKLSVKIPDTRRPSAQGQLLLHGHGGTAAHTPPYQGACGHYPQHLLKGASTHEDMCVYGAVTTPEGLASYPSHASMITDWNVGGLNSPLTARTNTFSVASGGYWGSMQLTSSSGSFGGWSAFTAGSGHSKAGSFRTGMAPQVSIEVIDWHCLQLGKRIGRGAEGSVYEARLQDAPVAVKEGPGMQEIEMYLAAGVHDNIVGLRGLCHRDDGTWCLVLEWCRGTLDTLLHHSSSPLPRAQHPLRSSSNGTSGSSSDDGRGTPTSTAAVAAKAAHVQASPPRHLHSSSAAATTKAAAAAGVGAAATCLHSRPDLVKVLPLMRSIARGLLHLHSRRPAILHRDIKPANIFVGHGMVMKIGDFGMSRHVLPTPADSAAAGSRSSWGSATPAARHGSSNGGGGLRSSTPGTRGCRGSVAGAINSSRLPDSAAAPGVLAPAPLPPGLEGNSRNVQQQQHPQDHSQMQQRQHQEEQVLQVAGVGCSSAATAVPVRTLTPGVVGTIAYSAPEVLDEQLQQPNPTVERILKADVYSLGVTMWEMLERRRPLEGLDGMQICAMWIADPQQMALPPLTIADNASDHEQKVLTALQDLVCDCTAFNPDARPNMKQVLERIRQVQRLCDPKTAATAAAAATAAGGSAVAVGTTAAAAVGMVIYSPTNGSTAAGCESAANTTAHSSRLIPAAAEDAAASTSASSTRVLYAASGGVTDASAAAAIAAERSARVARDTATSCQAVSGGGGSPSSAKVGGVLLAGSNNGPRAEFITDVTGGSSLTRHKRSSSDTDAQGVADCLLQGLQDPLWHACSLPPRLSVGRDRRISGQGLMQRHVH